MLRTKFCRDFGIDVPILSAPLGGGGAGPELDSAVSNAGGLGLLGMGGAPASFIRVAIRRDAVIAQGFEAGGHVRGAPSLAALLPAVVDAVKPLPVIAVGGIANGRGVVAAPARWRAGRNDGDALRSQ